MRKYKYTIVKYGAYFETITEETNGYPHFEGVIAGIQQDGGAFKNGEFFTWNSIDKIKDFEILEDES
ncbi:hypothetical protein EBT16_00965 [bacterium]|nr:hypothetical protein [bacterium]